MRLDEVRAGDVVLLHGVQVFSESGPSNAQAYDFGYSRNKACTHRGPELVWRDNGHGDAQKPMGECECVVAAHHLWDCKRHARELNTAPKAGGGVGNAIDDEGSDGDGSGSPMKRVRHGAGKAVDIAAEAGELGVETAVQRVLERSFMATVAPVRVAHVRWKGREGGGGEGSDGCGESSGADGGEGGEGGGSDGPNGPREALIHFTSLRPSTERSVGALELPPFVAHLDAAAVEALVQVEVRARSARKRQRPPRQQDEDEEDNQPPEGPAHPMRTRVSDADVAEFERILNAQAQRDDATATAFKVRVWCQRGGVPFVDEKTGCAAHFKMVPPYLEVHLPSA